MTELTQTQQDDIQQKLQILVELQNPIGDRAIKSQYNMNDICQELLEKYGMAGIEFIQQRISRELQTDKVAQQRPMIDALLATKQKRGISKEALADATQEYIDASEDCLRQIPLQQKDIVRIGFEVKAVNWMLSLAKTTIKNEENFETRFKAEKKKHKTLEKDRIFINGLLGDRAFRRKEHPINNALNKIKEVYTLDQSHVKKIEEFLVSREFQSLDEATQKAIKAQYEPYLAAAQEHLARMEAVFPGEDFVEQMSALKVKAEEGQTLSSVDQKKLAAIQNVIESVAAIYNDKVFMDYQQLAAGPILFNKQYGNVTYTSNHSDNAAILAALNEPFKKLDSYAQLFPDLLSEVSKYEKAMSVSVNPPSEKLIKAHKKFTNNQSLINEEMGKIKPVASFAAVIKTPVKASGTISEFQSTKVSFYGAGKEQGKIDTLFKSLSQSGTLENKTKKRLLRSNRQWQEAKFSLGENYRVRKEKRRHGSGDKLTVSYLGVDVFKVKHNGEQIDINFINPDLDNSGKHMEILSSLLNQVSQGLVSHHHVVVSSSSVEIAQQLLVDTLNQTSRPELLESLKFSKHVQQDVEARGIEMVRIEQPDRLSIRDERQIQLFRARIQKALDLGLSPTTGFSFDDQKMDAVREAFHHSFVIDTKNISIAIKQYTDLIEKRSHGKIAHPELLRHHVQKSGILPKVIIPIQNKAGFSGADEVTVQRYHEAISMGLLPTLEARENAKLIASIKPAIEFSDRELGLAQLTHMLSSAIVPENTHPKILAGILKQAKRSGHVFTIEGEHASNVHNAYEWMLSQGFEVQLNAQTRRLFTQEGKGLDEHVLTDIHKFGDLKRAIESGFKVELDSDSIQAILTDIKKNKIDPKLEFKGFNSDESEYLFEQLQNMAELESQLGIQFAIEVDYHTKDVLKQDAKPIKYQDGKEKHNVYKQPMQGFDRFMDRQINDFVEKYNKSNIANMYVQATNTHNLFGTHYKDVNAFWKSSKKNAAQRQQNITSLVRRIEALQADSRQFENPLDRVAYMRAEINKMEQEVKQGARFKESKLVKVLAQMKGELEGMEQRFRASGFADKPVLSDGFKQAQAGFTGDNAEGPSIRTGGILLQRKKSQADAGQFPVEPPKEESGPSIQPTTKPKHD